MKRSMSLRFRPSLAKRRRQNQAALDYYRGLSPREDAPRIDVGARPKQTRSAPDPADSEAPVLSAVAQLLAAHPKVAIAIRTNSGMAWNAVGQPVRFHRLLRGDGVVVDTIGVLVDGRPLALECKRPSWVRGKASGDDAEREDDQAAYIDRVIRCGGVGGFVRSVDEAVAVLDAR